MTVGVRPGLFPKTPQKQVTAMARLPRDHRLETREARAKLKARGEPYWRLIVPGTFIGYRKGKRAAAWVARQRTAAGYAEQRIGTPDDTVKPDGNVVLSYGQAVARAQAIQVEARTPLPAHFGDGSTFNEIFDAYIEDRLVTPGGPLDHVMAESTAATSRDYWNRHARGGIGAELVGSLNDKILRKWHIAMASVAPTIRGKVQPFDPSDPEQVRSRRATANRVLTIAKAALSWGYGSNTLPTGVTEFWRKVKPFKLGDDPVPRMLDREEITRLLNAAPEGLRQLLQGALMTGARYSDVRGIRVRDYDPETSTVRVAGSKVYTPAQQPLTGEGVALFDRLTAGRDSDEFVFVRADGSPWGSKDAIRPMRATAAAARLDGVTFKTTRSTYGKLLLQATKDLELVAKALGHGDSRITRKHYAALLPSEVQAGVVKLPALGFQTDSKVSRIGKKRRAGQ